MIWPVVFCSSFAILNRARGSKLFRLTDSTEEARIFAMLGMAILTMMLAMFLHCPQDTALLIFVWTWAGLLLWASPAWDTLWGIEIGNEPNHSRLWGLIHMTLRQSLIIPTILGLNLFAGRLDHAAYVVSLVPLLSLTYFISGYILPASKPVLRRFVIALPESLNGAIIGTMIWIGLV